MASVEDVGEFKLEQIRMSLRNESGFVQGGSALAFFEDGNEMFRTEEINGKTVELNHLEGVVGDF